jgi:hypothetical protein
MGFGPQYPSFGGALPDFEAASFAVVLRLIL